MRRRIDELFGLVGLGSAARGRYPHEFSGGQRRRISIACALAVQPDFIVAVSRSPRWTSISRRRSSI
jgi:ABC-type oligopeptide transport system ATPase subunit